MPRHIELRDDADAAVGRIVYNLTDLLLCVVQAIRAHLLQPGIFLALDPASLIVSQVPVENIHLDRRQPIYVALDDVHRLPVARDIDHQTAPCEPRLVLDVERREKVATLIRRNELQNRFDPAQCAGDRVCFQQGVLRSNFKYVRLILAKLRIFRTSTPTCDGENSPTTAGQTDRQLNPGFSLHALLKPPYTPLQTSIRAASCPDGERAVQIQPSRLCLNGRRHRHQVKRSNRR